MFGLFKKIFSSKSDDISQIEKPSFVICETAAAIVLHVRKGGFQECGHQDSDTLCGTRPAWDTRIPLEIISSSNPESRICRDCKRTYNILCRIDTEVAPNCMHRLPGDKCQEPIPGFVCPISSNVDLIIEAVSSVSSDLMEPYIEKLRLKVCGECRMETDGHCRLRDDANCCLYSFFPLIVDIVEQEMGER